MNDLAARIECGKSEMSNDEAVDGVGDAARGDVDPSFDRAVKKPSSIIKACKSARCAALFPMGAERKLIKRVRRSF